MKDAILNDGKDLITCPICGHMSGPMDDNETNGFAYCNEEGIILELDENGCPFNDEYNITKCLQCGEILNLNVE